MKKLLKSIVLATSMLALVSCASNVTKDATETKSDKPFGIEEENYESMIAMSLLSKGNNYRLKKVIEKLRAGENVYIACLGGSVTEGAGPKDASGKELWKLGYAYQFNEKIRQVYTTNKGANVFFDGAGLSGTPSPLGLIRYENDVVDQLGGEPDLLVIEFAVNDGGECTNQRAFEQLIRNALSKNQEAAVIALYSAATYGNTQLQMKPVADHYGIPSVSVMDIVKYAIGRSYFTKEGFYTDIVHPTKEGHEIMADCLMNVLAVADAAPADEPAAIPENYRLAKPLTNFTRITGDDENVKIKAGGFYSKDPNTQGLKKKAGGFAPNNWYHKPGNANEPFVMEINCKALVFDYKVQGSWLNEKFGKADVYVDGVKKATYDGGTPGGWNNNEIRMLIDEAEAGKHVVEVKMAEGSENLGFTIVAMGYSK